MARPTRNSPARGVPPAEPLERRVMLAAQMLPARDGTAYTEPARLTDVNGTVFFTASDPDHGSELWRSDGTQAGTFMVKDIVPGPGDARPSELVAVGNTLYFAAVTPAGKDALWKSDGTAAGTVMVADAADGAPLGVFDELTNVNGRLFFVAYQQSKWHVWQSDGTAAGTHKISTYSQGFSSSEDHLCASGNRVYWDDSRQLMMFDRASGTVSTVKNFYSGPYYLTDANGTLYFAADDLTTGHELWKASGATASRVKDIAAGAAGSYPEKLANFNGTLVFWVPAPGPTATLWKSNGTGSGTIPLKETGHPYDTPRAVGATLYFSGQDAQTGSELWKTDGTAAGTVMVKDINPGPAGSVPREMTAAGGFLYFVAHEMVWRSDGTAAGTRPLVRTNADGTSSPRRPTASGANVYFTASDGTSNRVWRVTPPGLAGVTGNVLNDRDGDGARDAGEGGLAGRVVYHDADNDGVLDPAELRTVTDDAGDYRLDGLPPGAYRVRAYAPAGWRQTAPASGAAQAVTLSASQTVGGKNFAQQGTRPRARDARYTLVTPPGTPRRRALGVNFDGFSSVLPSVGADDVTLVNTDTGQTVPSSAITVVPWTGVSPTAAGGVAFALANSVPAGNYHATLRAAGIADLDGYALAGGDFDVDFFLPSLVTRQVLFYNNSSFDGSDPAANAADDKAIATDKRPLLPGASPQYSEAFGSISTYSRGLNGLILDVVGLPPDGAGGAAALSAADFDLRVGDDPALATWAAAPAPSAVAVRRGGGSDGADRVTLIWPDGAIRNTWLRVAVRATPRTGLAAPLVFYFGHFAGDTGIDPRRRFLQFRRPEVNFVDVLAVRRAISTRTASALSPLDFDHDGKVTVSDLLVVREALLGKPLRLFVLPQ